MNDPWLCAGVVGRCCGVSVVVVLKDPHELHLLPLRDLKEGVALQHVCVLEHWMSFKERKAVAVKKKT